MRWAYGVTTVPGRRGNLLPRTLASLRAGGFDRPRLFMDGADRQEQDACLGMGWDVDWTFRWPALRTHGNWLLSAYELYIREPLADLYAIFQDDLICSKNLKAYLSRCTLPERAYLNLHTFPVNHQVCGKAPGWYEARTIPRERGGHEYHGKQQQYGKSALGLVFTREGLVTLLHAEHMARRPMDANQGWRRVDGGIVESMNKAGWREYVHNPSLLRHTGDGLSSMGNAPYQPADTFLGEDFDLLTLRVP